MLKNVPCFWAKTALSPSKWWSDFVQKWVVFLTLFLSKKSGQKWPSFLNRFLTGFERFLQKCKKVKTRVIKYHIYRANTISSVINFGVKTRFIVSFISGTYRYSDTNGFFPKNAKNTFFFGRFCIGKLVKKLKKVEKIPFLPWKRGFTQVSSKVIYM